MKILDWIFFTFYCFTMNHGSRFERANFIMWYSSSFIYVSFFYFILILLKVHISKYLFLPLFIAIFTLNFIFLYYIYIKKKRSSKIVEMKGEASRSFKIFSRFFAILFTFVAMGISIVVIIYYGKHIHFL